MTVEKILAMEFNNPAVQAGAIIALAIIIAIILRILVLPLLKKLARKTTSNFDDGLVDVISPALLRTVVLMGLNYAMRGYVDDPTLNYWIDGIVMTLMVMMWGQAALKVNTAVCNQLSVDAERFSWIQPSTLPLIQFTFRVIIVALQAYLILSAWEISLTSWLASAGVMGIAVGFAAKDTLANFIAGIFILVDAPYKVGQYIVIDNTTRGVVTDIGMRSTRLLTRDNVEVTVPNAVIGNAKIVNESSGPSLRMRVRVNVSVAYGSDVDEVRELLLGCVDGLANVVDISQSSIRFKLMGDSGLHFQVRVWVNHPVHRGRVVDALNTRIYKALNEAKIEVPFPQQDIRIKEWPAGLPASATDGAS
jgi:MscS family membrane protein